MRKTIDAVIGYDNIFWELGDALVEEADFLYAGPKGLRAVSEELAEHGFEVRPVHLAALRRVAVAFPSDRRHNLSWKVHAAARTADVLDAIVKSCAKTGEPVTSKYVDKVLRGMMLTDAWEKMYQDDFHQDQRAQQLARKCEKDGVE